MFDKTHVFIFMTVPKCAPLKRQIMAILLQYLLSYNSLTAALIYRSSSFYPGGVNATTLLSERYLNAIFLLPIQARV